MVENPSNLFRPLDGSDEFAARIEMVFGDAPRSDENVQASQLRTGEFDGFFASARCALTARRVFGIWV